MQQLYQKSIAEFAHNSKSLVDKCATPHFFYSRAIRVSLALMFALMNWVAFAPDNIGNQFQIAKCCR